MKSQLSKFLILLAMIALAGFGCKPRNSELRTQSPESTQKSLEFEIQDATNRNARIVTKFVPEVAFGNTKNIKPESLAGYPVAGIVNHHSLAMDLQARFFQSLQESRPGINKFIIISPDHFLAGDLVSTHGFVYATPAGEVKTQAFKMDSVYNAKDVKVFQNEHGVGALAPFIAREFPEAEVVPVYIRPEAGREQLEKLGDAIAELVDEETFVILSSDMSHYLKDEEARENDKLTMSWIENREWDKLESASDDYTDSAQGFVVLEALFSSLKQDIEFDLLDNAVSTDYGADPKETTSYINGFYIVTNSR